MLVTVSSYPTKWPLFRKLKTEEQKHRLLLTSLFKAAFCTYMSFTALEGWKILCINPIFILNNDSKSVSRSCRSNIRLQILCGLIVIHVVQKSPLVLCKWSWDNSNDMYVYEQNSNEKSCCWQSDLVVSQLGNNCCLCVLQINVK